MKIHKDAKKPSKAEAYQLVKYLKDGIALMPEQVDSLVLYFAPPKPKQPKTIWDWVARACNPKDERTLCKHVWVENNVAYATDGHRVHIGAVEGYEDGGHCPTTGAFVEGAVMDGYPKRIMRAYNHNVGTVEPVELDSVSEHLHTFGGKEHRVTVAPNGRGVSANYLEEAIAGKDVFGFGHRAESGGAFSGSHEWGAFCVMELRL